MSLTRKERTKLFNEEISESVCIFSRNQYYYGQRDIDNVIPLDMIKFLSDYYYKFIPSLFSKNKNLTLEFIKLNYQYEWKWEVLLTNPVITLDFFDNLVVKYKYFYYSKNPNLTSDYILKHKNEDWNWGAWGISSNPSISLELLTLPRAWDYSFLSSNPAITEEYVRHNMDRRWNIERLVTNPSISREFLREIQFIPNENYYYYVTPEELEKEGFPNMTIWYELSSNPNITPEFIEKYIDKPWHFKKLKNINEDLLTKFPFLIDKIALTKNIPLSDEFIKKYKLESRIQVDYSKRFINKIRDLMNKYREYMAAYKIQQYYFKALTDPNTELGFKRANRNFDEYIVIEN